MRRLRRAGVLQVAAVFTDDKIEDTLEGYEIWKRAYHCAKRMAKVWGCDVGIAQARIIEEKPTHRRRFARAQAFKDADEKAAQEFTALDTKSKRRSITVLMVCEVVQGLFLVH